jgi:hypothetical protein
MLRRAKSSSSASASSSAQQQLAEQWDPTTAGVTNAVGIGCGKRDDLHKAWQQHQAQQQQQRQQAGTGSAARTRGQQQRIPRVTTECEVRYAVVTGLQTRQTSPGSQHRHDGMACSIRSFCAAPHWTCTPVCHVSFIRYASAALTAAAREMPGKGVSGIT